MALFPEPVLLVVKRLSAQDGSSRTFASSKEFMKLMIQLWEHTPTTTSVLLWEDRFLPDTHPLMDQFNRWGDLGVAKVHSSMMPQERDLTRLANKILEPFGATLDQSGATWLREQYRFQEQAVRLASRKKATDILVEDERSWWLPQILEGAALRSLDSCITAKQLEEGQRSMAQPVSVFEISQACTGKQWSVLREKLYDFSTTAEAGDFFGLLGALKWQLQRGNSSLSPSLQSYAMRLLNEVELILKNAPLEGSWLFDLFVDRLEQFGRSSDRVSLIPPRTLWLAQLPRS
jgi:hypothetical protein